MSPPRFHKQWVKFSLPAAHLTREGCRAGKRQEGPAGVRRQSQNRWCSENQLPASLMILWDVPGTGKSTFARWLVEYQGFMNVDTDAIVMGRAKATGFTEAWQQTHDGKLRPAVFMTLRHRRDARCRGRRVGLRESHRS